MVKSRRLFPVSYAVATQSHPEAPTTGDKRCVMGIDHLSYFRGLRGALRHVSARSMAQHHMTLKLNWVYVRAKQQRQLRSYYFSSIPLLHGL